ncbi:hypothetical protein HPP92_010385 [Vanilla planifolia]|uniref:Germin-like protein n=1 Tax=Vanilla planifolia TaxID=51239 RepID=A0A835QYT0_VANPL|nr:hypothetical protein HPP92_010385 [Vanilla planifolia]
MALSKFIVVLIALLAVSLTAHAGDPDITTDFKAPNGKEVDGNFFTFRGLRQTLWGAPKDGTFKATKATRAEFPALEGQSVSLAVLQFPPKSINPPHIHQRSAELLFVLKGTLHVGFVDSANKLYTQVLHAGDTFVNPKGLVHFQANQNPRNPALVVSAFGSSDAGTMSLPRALFGSGIDQWILAESFKTDIGTIDRLVSANNP